MPQSSQVKVLFVADIVGKPGFDITSRFLPSLLRKHDVDFCIANGENAHDGPPVQLVPQTLRCPVSALSLAH